MLNKKKFNQFIPLSLYPTLVWLLLFLIIPLLIVISFSLMKKGSYGAILPELDFSNYKRVLEPVFLKIIFRSFLLAFFTTLICLMIAYPMTYFMAKSKESLKKLLLTLIVIPFWTNFIIRVYALKLIIGENGLINRILLELNLLSKPLELTDNMIGLSIGMIYNYLPFMILPLFVAIDKIDFTLLDAAYDLGASKIQTLFKVLLPLSLPGIITGSLFVFIPAFGEFVIPDLLGGSQNMFVGNLITETFLKSRDWPFGSALSSLLVLFSMLYFIIVLKNLNKKTLKEI
jgi:spermidine/putrescine transport system permease protein